MFRRRRKRVLNQEEINQNLERLRSRFPSFVIDQIAEELKGKEITAEKLEKIIEDIGQKIEEVRIDKKVENLSEQISSITNRVGSIGKIEIPESAKDVSARIDTMREKADELTKLFEKTKDKNTKMYESLKESIDKVEKEIGGIGQFSEWIEDLENKTDNLTLRLEILTKDVRFLYGGINVTDLVGGS
jgi:methyl-accepting chemotaxis protein